MTHSTKVVGASALIGMLIAVVWLHAPILPAVIGTLGASALLWRRTRAR